MSESEAGYLTDVVDVIFALVLMVGAVAAAEFVRVTCRRQLTTPLTSPVGRVLAGATDEVGELEAVPEHAAAA